MKQKLEIAIIGGGASGIVAAKSAQEAGITCTLFEKEECPGGVWRPNGLAWENMRVNISRFTGVFSDFSWEQAFPDCKRIPIYPNTQDMYAYLLAYIKHFQLEACIHYGRTVIHIGKNDIGWKITWQENGCIKQQNFDAVILATGSYQVPYIPKFKGLKNFSGQWLHSANYHSPTYFDDKSVLVIGGSFSGVAIASELANQVQHLIRKPRWIMPTDIPAKLGGAKIPRDLIDTRQDCKVRDFAWFMQYCSTQNNIPAWKMTAETPLGRVVSNVYVEKVLRGDIKVIKNEIDHFSNSGIILKNGDEIQSDTIIFCTGYKLDFSFFDKSIIPLLNPLDLYADTFHPNLPGIAWIAINYKMRGAIFPLAELQSRFACAVFSGRLKLPTPEQMQAEINPSFKHNFLTFANLLAEKLGINDFEQFLHSDPELYRLLLEGPIVPAQYRVAGYGSKVEVAKAQLLAVEKAKKQFLGKGL